MTNFFKKKRNECKIAINTNRSFARNVIYMIGITH
jgi:hypothetical protein